MSEINFPGSAVDGSTFFHGDNVCLYHADTNSWECRSTVQETEQALSKAVRENLKRNVLCGDLDLSTGTVAAVIAIGDQQTLDKIPQEHLDNAFNQLNRTLKTNSTVHQGIYKGAKKGLSLFTAIGGISTPEDKLESLLKSSQ